MPSRAAADTFFTRTSAGRSRRGTVPPNLKSKFVYGGDLMWLGTSGVGFELDFAYHPNFFEPGDDEELFDFDSDGNVRYFHGQSRIRISGRRDSTLRHRRVWAHANEHLRRHWFLR